MARFLLLNGPAAGQILDLPPGVYRIGRDADNAIQVDDPSISGRHCEVIVETDEVRVVDLGSANGTRVGGNLEESATVGKGQIIELGTLSIQYEPPPAAPAIRVAGTSLTSGPAPRVPGYLERNTAPVGTFWQALPGIVAYPFRGNGIITLIGGAVFLAIADFVQARAFLVGFMVALVVFGYLVAYLQSVVMTSAGGEPSPPPWPDFSDLWSDVIRPYLLWLALVIVCLGPALAVGASAMLGAAMRDVAPDPTRVGIAWGLGAAGLVYLPMALLATAMADSLAGLNPLLVIPSIVRVFGPYLVTCVVLGGALAAQIVADLVLQAVAIPIVSPLASWFVSLTLLLMGMRLLGLLFRTCEDRLGWDLGSGRR